MPRLSSSNFPREKWDVDSIHQECAERRGKSESQFFLEYQPASIFSGQTENLHKEYQPERKLELTHDVIDHMTYSTGKALDKWRSSFCICPFGASMVKLP